MVSKKRITVNFSYPELHQMIVSLAKRTGSSSSAVIQDMILDALKYRMENDALLPSGKLVANKNLVPEKVFNAGFEINNLTIDGKIRGATDSFHRLFQRGEFIETLPYMSFAGMQNPVNAINRREILERVISYLQARLHVSDNTDFKPELLLFFIGAVFLSGFCMSRNHRMNWPPHQRETLLVAQVSDIDFLVTPQRLKP